MEKVIILDFGSQYTLLLARRIREVRAYSEVISPSEKPSLDDVKGIILSGGPKSVLGNDSFEIPEWVYKSNLPILGICYGMQALTLKFGGKVEKSSKSEYGKTPMQLIYKSALLKDLPDTFTVWMSHGDSVVKEPENAEILAVTKNGVIAGYKIKNRDIYALQFHPEVSHTEYGKEMISNFIFDICKITQKWALEDFVDAKVEEIRKNIGNSKAIIGLSGGVDSTVAAILTYKAIGDNLKAVLVNHGFMRANEIGEVSNIFREFMGKNLIISDERKNFLTKLSGVIDPEKKRKIIGEEFIRAFEREAKKDKKIDFLIQGTIYSDVIESAASGENTVKIKSHHNVGGLPEYMNLKIIEPLRELFKDEVRKLGEILGLPKSMLYRHPFPGPGLAIRIIGEITEEKLEILRKADKIFIDTLKNKGWYDKVWQAFAVLTDVRTVGVVGDERNYGYLLALRAVDSVEGMTADWSKLPHDILEEVSNKITAEIKQIGRVVYDITSKPPATIEWE